MKRDRQSFPYETATSVLLQPAALNLLAQLKLPGEPWSTAIERIGGDWATAHGIKLSERLDPWDVFRVRTDVQFEVRQSKQEAPHE
jgi:hypothetical protein